MEPDNKNFLFGHSYRLTIARFPNVAWFCQYAVLPGLSMPPISIPHPNVNVPFHGDHIIYQNLPVRFQVDENLVNWQSLFEWFKLVGFDENDQQYQQALNKYAVQGRSKENSLYSDATLSVLSNKFNPKFEFVFKDFFPIDLGGLPFSTTVSDAEPVTCEAIFSFTSYSVRPS